MADTQNEVLSDREQMETIDPANVGVESITDIEINVEDRAGTMLTVDPILPASPKTFRPRNYSHLERNPDTMDDVQGCDGITYKIPAAMGSNYWGVLVAMYEKVNSPVYPEQLVKRVDEIMREHNEENWDAFCNKSKTTVWKRGSQQREVKPIKSIHERIFNNAKTLTRYKDYGKRLHERGHALRYEYDGKMQPYFILRTNLDCLTKKKEETDGN